MHLCRTVECVTSGLHLSVFYLGHPPPSPPLPSPPAPNTSSRSGAPLRASTVGQRAGMPPVYQAPGVWHRLPPAVQ